MKKISLKGVVIGNIVDIVAMNIVLLPVMILVVAASMSGAPSGLAPQAVAGIIKEGPAFLISSTDPGALCSVLGGYVAARIAKHDEALNGALSSILCVDGGVYVLISGSTVSPMWLHLVFLPLSPALGVLGGLLRARQTARLG